MDIKKIAESLGLEGVIHLRDNFLMLDESMRKFDPVNNWSDTGLVLEALVKSDCAGVTIDDWLTETDRFRCTVDGHDDKYLADEMADTIQEAICKAYINTLGEG